MAASKWKRRAGEALFFVAVLWGSGLFLTRNHPRGEVADFTLPQLGGGQLALQDLKGRPTALVVWAPWCSVCKVQSDNVSRVRRWLEGRANVLSVVAAHRGEADVRRTVAAEGIDYPVLLADKAWVRRFQVDAFPTTYFLDAQGRVRSSASGYTTTFGFLWRLAFSGLG